MKLLALDTSSVACTVAIASDGEIVERHEVQPREHTRLLVPMIQSALAEAQIDAADLDGIVLGNGPGSFIGMRIATSVAQGMAHAVGIRIAPVSSLAAVAEEVFAIGEASHVVVTQDAHMDEVYLGVFARGPNGVCVTLSESLHDQSAIGLSVASPHLVAAGEGWYRYPALLEANREILDAHSEVRFPSARWLLPQGEGLFRTGRAIEPSEVVPAYLRQTVAKAAV
ncbi:MAG: tRNA (adenosine(37)-N6)-threonylcarbamoyltransferase complex dimerization subunit type 1 TsaB [Pseudomonadota bacterium]